MINAVSQFSLSENFLTSVESLPGTQYTLNRIRKNLNMVILGENQEMAKLRKTYLGRIQPDSDFAVLLLKLRIEAQKLKIENSRNSPYV